jgi:non-homologous end joining protein Ku
LTISFGLVSIPVKIFTTAQSGGGVSFNYLHKDCGSRLKQQYICIKEDASSAQIWSKDSSLQKTNMSLLSPMN